MVKKLDEFDKILAELLVNEDFRKAVCPDPAEQDEAKQFASAEAAIGSHRWSKIKKDEEKRALIEVACTYTDATSMQALDDILDNANKSASFYFTDW